MLREAVEKVDEVIRRGLVGGVVPSPEPPGGYWLHHPNGELSKMRTEAPEPKWEAHDIVSLVRAVSQYAEGEEKCASIWVSHQGVVGMLDHDRRYGRITFETCRSQAWHQAILWEEDFEWYEPDDMVRLLKQKFKGGADVSPSGALEAIAEYGRAYQYENVEVVPQPPEQITLFAPFFDGDPYPKDEQFVCAPLGAMPLKARLWTRTEDDGLIAITVLPGETTSALDSVMKSVMQMVRDIVEKHGCASYLYLYRGQP